MVQVDVFWSYGIGSTFAVAASRQLLTAHARAPRRAAASGVGAFNRVGGGRAGGAPRDGGAFDSKFFLRTVLYLALLFAPSGIWLLWAFPSWETMHAGGRDLPAWLVAAFAITNVTQGILGFWVAHRLIVRGRTYAAYLNIVLAYFAMFFVLVHGWDGTGYQRFFSATREDFLGWGRTPIASWFTSDVALTLYGMGVFLVPVMLGWVSAWIRDGYAYADPVREAGLRAPRPAALSLAFLAVVFGAGLGSAILASVLIHQLGWLLGAGIFAAAAWWLTTGEHAPCRALYRRLFLAGAPRPVVPRGPRATLTAAR